MEPDQRRGCPEREAEIRMAAGSLTVLVLICGAGAGVLTFALSGKLWAGIGAGVFVISYLLLCGPAD